jgi:uncharacterized membrane protein YgcG
MQAGWGNWVLDASTEWKLVHHPECLTLELLDRGALQFSSATRRSGRVDHAELQRVAARLNDGWGSAEAVMCGDFSGLLFSYVDNEGINWRRWFLGRGSILLFVTYTAKTLISTADEQLIQSTLDTLRVSTKADKFSLVRRGIAALRIFSGGNGSSGG